MKVPPPARHAGGGGSRGERGFLPQLCGRRGNPREWVFCHYFRDAGDPVKCFARDKRWKLHTSGDLLDLKTDLLEQHAVSPTAANTEATAARKRLQAVLDSLL